MSVYTSGIAQQYIDPFYISNERVEFRLDEDRVYLSGMRINNLTATTASGDGAKEVNNLAGFAGMIEHIYLYDNATIIDAMRHYPRYIAHKNLLVENPSKKFITKMHSSAKPSNSLKCLQKHLERL